MAKACSLDLQMGIKLDFDFQPASQTLPPYLLMFDGAMSSFLSSLSSRMTPFSIRLQ